MTEFGCLEIILCDRQDVKIQLLKKYYCSCWMIHSPDPSVAFWAHPEKRYLKYHNYVIFMCCYYYCCYCELQSR